jgi:predicted short-subunit dehydrogenase-like oxidoreductase (DUF2520 family)
MREDRTRACADFWDFAMTAILRYAARMTRKPAKQKQTVAVVGTGRLASFLSPALAEAEYTITEIIARARPQSLQRARALARNVDARAVTVENAALDADLVWFCVPDGEICRAAAVLAGRAKAVIATRGSSGMRFAFHSSGVLVGRELEPLRKMGVGVASVHPLMTFVAGARPSLAGVPFALEGDIGATELARRIVRDLGGESFLLPARRKAAYHTWATMSSPLLLTYLVTLEEVAREAGLKSEDARRMSLPIIRQTLENFRTLGPGRSFSGPLIRGDAETVTRHLALLKKHPRMQAVYVVLAQVALARLPVKNGKQLRRLLEDQTLPKGQ